MPGPAVPRPLPAPLDGWEEGVARLFAAPPPGDIAGGRWRTFQADAARVLYRHGAELLALCWDALDLFGLHPDAPGRRTDGAGLAWLLDGRPVASVAAQHVRVVIPAGGVLTAGRMGAQARREAVPAWTLSPTPAPAG